MKPTDPILLRLADLAKVRPPHVYILWATMKQEKARFNLGAFAAFTGLEVRHVQRMLDVFEAENVFCETPTSRTVTPGSRLPADITLPDEWRQFAQAQRFWTNDVCETVFDRFKDYWISAPRGTKLDWFATWRNWVRSTKDVADGEKPAAVAQRDPREWLDFCKRQVAHASRIGRIKDVEEWRKKLAKAEIDLAQSV